ncbi:15813_t:CDS:2, partial [Gigaspora margarita]
MGSVLIRVSITINSEMKTAKIGAENMLGNVYNQLNQADFFIPARLCPSVGIGDHALGRGFGYYSHKYSLAFDNIISMGMVNTTGDILQVDFIINSNLYFVLRGANYGIVMHFVFCIHRTPPQVTYIELEFNKTNMNQVYQLFDTFNEVGPSLDGGIALTIRLNKSSLSITGLYLGPCTEAQNAIGCFINASNSISTKFIPQTFFEFVEALSKQPNKQAIKVLVDF